MLYFWLAYVSDFEGMPEKTAWAYFIFFAPNLPWLLGYLCLAYRSFTAMVPRFRGTSASGVELIQQPFKSRAAP